MSTVPFRFVKRPLLRVNYWTIAVGAIALLIATPILCVLSSIFADSREIWQHLATTVLPGYITNSLLLMVGVGIGVFVIGTGTAWLVTMCSFWGSSVFEWALLLPLAAPAYLLAYVYTDFLDYFGPVQTGLRNLFGWESIQDYWFPDIRSLWGAIAMLVLVLYPYVYLLARVAFLEQCTCTIEASRSLGCSPWRSFFKVAIPLARPSIIAGLALALMETLNDFGTVQFFGITTFTTGIYRTWLGMGERVAAAQLAAILMLFILVLIVLERLSRSQARYYQTMSFNKPGQSYPLTGIRGVLAQFACGLPVVLGFLLPIGILCVMTLANTEQTLDPKFLTFGGNSLILAGVTAALGVAIALIMAYGQRLNQTLGMRLAVRTAAMGYAIPGSVIAVGVLIPIGQLDNAIDRFMRANFNISTGLLLSGTIAVLIFAYLVRFLAVSFNTVESSLGKIEPNLDDASRSLGYNATDTLFKVHAPLMGSGLLTAVMLVFVDVMKELPATLVIRPFNFDTLAVQVYQYASDERLIEASAPALAIILVGTIPVLFLSSRIARSRL
ncbi:ABC transporter permease [Lusitaniella coriacea]|uniref:ABC transporter permease n=1 Tax=Lusitaniella coriacea TaxID=1983105 RepID=UPI003CEB22B0